MNREIKFRAWDKKEKYMGFVLGAYFTENGWVDIETGKEETDTEDRARLKDVELMQYTGFKDKNEKEIYEGDILKSKHGTTNGYSFQHVLWGENDGAFYVEFNSSWYSLVCLLHSGMGHTVEVIGNIYENPKLLK